MSDPLPLGSKKLVFKLKKAKSTAIANRRLNVFFLALTITVFGLTLRLLDTQPTLKALAYTSGEISEERIDSPLFTQNSSLFQAAEAEAAPKKASVEPFSQKIYDLVGDSPIKEMVPFIALRDQKVAAFLIGIAKKESSFGSASPSKNGETCYNYWGYKGSAGRGTGMGYACFASAEEAVEIVGNRIQVLVEKNRSTPAKMVDTWKCGTSCAGDPGAPSWVSTVALYFNELVDQKS